jgi:peptide/nickel transport system permease protein
MSFVIKRAAVSVALLVATSVLIFVVLRALPGDPVAARLGTAQGVSQETINRLRASAGLDRPLVSQYLSWVSGMLHGDLGTSYSTSRPVSSMIGSALGPTLELTMLGVGLSVALSVPAATAAARRPGGWLDRLITAVASAGMAFPPFVAGLVLIIVFSIGLHWLPARGYVPFTQDAVTNVRDMILPAISLTVGAAPLILRYLRGELVTVLNADYVRTAAGKGAPEPRVIVWHALPNAALPSLTMVGLVTGYTLGGSVVVEYVFGFSGLGALSVDAAFRRDYAVLQSVVLLISALFILVSLTVDLIGWRLDPRTRAVRHG